MSKNLIVCFDGTWNNPDQEDNGVAAPTNVVQLRNALAENDKNGTKQEIYYHPGVGGEDIGWFQEVFGGAFGAGISRHIQSAYHWLGSNYKEGDRIYLFGFSRGAFTVRSLAGFINKGLLDLRDIKYEDKSWEQVKSAYDDAYRKKRSVKEIAKDDWKFFNGKNAVDIHFLGVWDTVGALGIPDDLELLNLLDNKNKWSFHDTELGKNVLHARHAMAIDEIRACFTVTRWCNASEHPDAKEVWFPGVHSDVGGGYAQSDLSNGALKWMIEESSKFKLKFKDNLKIQADPCGVIHNSYKGFFSKLRSRPRNYPAISNDNKELFHESVFQRQKNPPLQYPPYHPVKKLEKGDSCSIDIFAGKHWNRTNIYFETGQKYSFSAEGRWLDSSESCNWEGTEGDKYTIGDVIRGVSSFWGRFEGIFKGKNASTDFSGTKRVEKFNWFIMVGAIANDGDNDKDENGKKAMKNDGSPYPHQYIDMTQYDKSTPFTVEKPGYLYCFPNDAWCFYGNNHGSIRLTVKREE